MSKKNTNIINEDNLPLILTDLYTETNSYAISYSKIKELVDIAAKKERYCSIKDNYDAIFIYEMVERQVPIEEYKDAIRHLSIQSDVDLHRFFSNDYDYDDVFKDGVKIKSSSVWSNMAALFLDIHNEKFIFDEHNLEYLLPLIEHITPRSTMKFHEARLTFQMSFILGNEYSNNSSITILKAIKENPIFETELAEQYHSFFNGITSYLGSNAYEWSKKEMNNALFCLSEAYPDSKERITNYLITKDRRDKNKLKIELSSRFFTPYLGEKEFIKNLQTAYMKGLEKNKDSAYNITDLRESIKRELSIGYEKYNKFSNINFNELININDDYFVDNNYIAITFLDIASKNNVINIDHKISKKMLSIIIDETNYSGLRDNIITQNYVPENYTQLKSLLEFNSLNDSIITTNKEKNKPKI